MTHYGHHYIDGTWVAPTGSGARDLIDPLTEEPFGTITQGGTAEDVDLAVMAARRAFVRFSVTSVAERVELIDSIIAAYSRRVDDFASILAQEIGAPFSVRAQASGPIGHMQVARDLLKSYAFETQVADTIIRREPIGVCALISPWNWPVQTPVIKLIYGLAAGCTMVAKPSDASPVCSILLAEVLHEAGVPHGVFNLVLGRGRIVGEALSGHPEVDLISFTGSTTAGVRVGEIAARTVKRTVLELGGKSANIVLTDADLEKAARWTLQRCFFNAGQSCHAPSRLLVHRDQVDTVLPYLADEAAKFRLGDPRDSTTTMGPLVNAAQFASVQGFIQKGLDEGARLVSGGPGRPEGVNRGYFTRPTVFADVTPDMTIARDEIFGPVLAVIPYKTEDDALAIANDSIFGLGGYVFSQNRARGRQFANGLRAGRISFNGAATNSLTPMGGYKQSGIGRSMGVYGLEEYLEVKSIYGFEAEAHELPDGLHGSGIK